MGDSNAIADTADLQLETNATIDISKVTNGDAFPLYPRKTIVKNTLLITGATSLGKSSITYGKSARTFVVFQIETKDINPQKPYLKLIPTGTHIYLSGEDITDQDKNFSQLEF